VRVSEDFFFFFADHVALGLKRKVESAGEKQEEAGNKRVEIDVGPEEGELFEEVCAESILTPVFVKVYNNSLVLTLQY